MEQCINNKGFDRTAPLPFKIDVNITGWTYAKYSGSFLAIVADVRSDTKIKTKVKGEKTSVLKVRYTM